MHGNHHLNPSDKPLHNTIDSPKDLCISTDLRRLQLWKAHDSVRRMWWWEGICNVALCGFYSNQKLQITNSEPVLCAFIQVLVRLRGGDLYYGREFAIYKQCQIRDP